MSDDDKPSLGLSLLAAALPLGTVPIGYTLFALHAGRGLGGVADAWVEGGWAMYGCLAAAVVASLASSAGAFFAARSSALGAVTTPIGALITLLVGVAGYHQVMASSLVAVTHAAPRNRGVIMAGVTSEVAWDVIFPLFLCAALFAMSGAAFLLGGLARRGHADAAARRALAGLGLACVPIAVWSVAMARTTLAVEVAFRALARASPIDRLPLIALTLEDSTTGRRVELLALVAMLLAVVVVAALLHASVRHLAAVVAFALVSVAGLGGLRALAQPTRDVEELIAEGVRTEKLIDLDAFPVNARDFDGVVLDAELTRDGERVTDVAGLMQRFGDREALLLGLGVHATADGLERTLRAALDAGVTSVVLVGVHTLAPPAGVDVPAVFRDTFTTYRGLALDLGRAAELCPEGCEWSTLSASTLTTPDGAWPLIDSSLWNTYGSAPQYFVEWGRFDPAVLLRAAHAAAAHEHRLALVAPSRP